MTKQSTQILGETMKSKVAIHARVAPAIRSQMKGFAEQKGITMSEVTELAIAEYLNPEDYKKVALRYLADIERADRSLLKRLDLIEETIGQFVYLYFFYTPEMADDAAIRTTSIASARSRFDGFLSLVSKRISGSKSYRDSFEEVHFAKTSFHTDGGGK